MLLLIVLIAYGVSLLTFNHIDILNAKTFSQFTVAKMATQSVLHCVLVTMTRVMCPFTPFFTEYLYQQLRKLNPNYILHVQGPKYTCRL